MKRIVLTVFFSMRCGSLFRLQGELAGPPIPREDCVIVIFLSKSEATVGEQLPFSVAVYNRNNREIMVPDPKEISISFENVSIDQALVLPPLTVSTTADGPQLLRLKPREHLVSQRTLTVPDIEGIVLIGVEGKWGTRVPLAIHSKQKKSIKRTTDNFGAFPRRV